MICLIIHEIWTFAIGFVKTLSATLLFTGNVPRGVFANKVHRKNENLSVKSCGCMSFV